MSFEGLESLQFTPGSLLVLGAATCWGLENNCTRKISSKDTYEIVVLKGAFSGLGSFVVALVVGETLPELPYAAAAMLLGFVAYGLSIFLYVRAQSVLGAAKTSAYYAIAPFVGALLSFLVVGEELSAIYAVALVVMMAGTSLVVVDTLVRDHVHAHAHTFVHEHDGIVHEHTVVHSHDHRHYVTDDKHGHSHTLAELEHASGHLHV